MGLFENADLTNQFSYCIYDPADKQRVVPFSGTPYVPDSVINAVHRIRPETIGERFAYLTNYLGSEPVVSTPAEINGIPVRAINCFAYKKYASSVKEVIIPENVCYCHITAFKGCLNLETLSLTSDCQPFELPAASIQNCKKLFRDGLFVLSGQLYADKDCEGLTDVTLPSNVHTLVNNAFACHRYLKQITIPESVKRILPYAFMDCSALETIVVQGSPSIGNFAFCGCERLSQIVFRKPIVQSGSGLFANCIRLRRIDVPIGVESIPGWFSGCKGLKNITLPDTLHEVSDRAFSGCKSLRQLTIPASVRKIGSAAFQNSECLREVVITSKTISIGQNAFDGCPTVCLKAFPEAEDDVASTGVEYTIIESDTKTCFAQRSIYNNWLSVLPKSLSETVKAGAKTFTTSTGITIKFDSQIAKKNLDSQGKWYDLYVAEAYYKTKEEVADEILREDPEMRTDDYFFAKARIDPAAPILQKDELEDYRKRWEALCCAAYDAGVLEEIGNRCCGKHDTDENTVNIACACAVNDATKVLVLTGKKTAVNEIRIQAELRPFSPEELFRIEQDIVSTCPALFCPLFSIPDSLLARVKERTVPARLPSNEPNAGPKPPAKTQAESVNLSAMVSGGKIEARYFEDSGIETVSIPEGIVSIEPWAFKNCTELKEVILPHSLKRIGVGAFERCSSLKHIRLPDGILCIDDGAFSGCVGLEWIQLPSNLKKVTDCLFEGCTALKEIILPEKLEHIGARAFSHCSGLSVLQIPNSVKYIEYSAFSDCISLTDIALPKELEVLQGRVFKGCTDLHHVTIPRRITSLGKRLFLQCSELESVCIPDEVTKIGESAFEGCSKLSMLKIPARVTVIEKRAFFGCRALTRLTLYDSLEKLAGDSFAMCPNLVLCVPSGTKAAKRVRQSGFRWEEIVPESL